MWVPSTTTFEYSWYRDNAGIDGATLPTYTPTAADVGATLTVSIEASAAGYASMASTSAGTALVAPLGTIRPVSSPRITGAAVVGSTLSAQAGTYDPSLVQVAYQWLRDGTPIPRATASTYRPAPGDATHQISLRVTVSAPGFAPLTATAGSVKVLNVFVTRASVITGPRQVGKTLSASMPAWTPATTQHGIQWYRNGTAIPGAKSTRYTLSGSDAGTTVTVSITGTRAGYATVTRISSAGTIAKAAAPKAITAPHISGTAKNGATLTVSNGAWNVAGLSPHFSWYRSGAAVNGATSRTFRLSSADVGQKIQARVTVTRTGFANGTATSNVIGKVAQMSASFKGNGVYRVGRDIPVGTFFSGNTSGCYWARLTTASTSDTSNIIANDIGNGQRMITIRASDQYVQLSDCGSWYPISAAGPARTTIPSEGVFKVGQQIVPGTYQVHYSDSCYWALLSATDGDFGSILTNDYLDGSGTTYVAIDSSDYAFQSSSCGTWTKVG